MPHPEGYVLDTHIPVRKIVKQAEARNTKQRRIIKATMAELGDFISAQDLHLTLANLWRRPTVCSSLSLIRENWMS